MLYHTRLHFPDQTCAQVVCNTARDATSLRMCFGNLSSSFNFVVYVFTRVFPRCCECSSTAAHCSCQLNVNVKSMIVHERSKARRVDTLAHSRPLGKFCADGQCHFEAHKDDHHSLCMPFRYFFSFRSKILYLSFGSISSSLGISVYHRCTAFVVWAWPFRCKAALTTSTTLSTRRRRFRCRAF
jgi:hypothetical protein